MNNIDWFTENYIESQSSIMYLLQKAEKYHNITSDQLREACENLRSVLKEPTPLQVHIRLITNMTDVGISSSIAGKKLREAILATRCQSSHTTVIDKGNTNKDPYYGTELEGGGRY